MASSTENRLYFSTNGLRHAIGPDDARVRDYHESLVRVDYDRCHPDDSFEDLKRRAGFSKEDQGLLSQWLDVAAGRAIALAMHNAPSEDRSLAA